MRQRSLFRTCVAVIAIGLIVVGVPARAQVPEHPAAVALLQAKIYGYATPVIVVTPGDAVSFVNIDLEMHDVVQDVAADGVGAKKPMPWCKGKKVKGHRGHGSDCPIFWTPLISLGKTTPIYGLENVKPGETYSFLCTLHSEMKGTLVVQ